MPALRQLFSSDFLRSSLRGRDGRHLAMLAGLALVALTGCTPSIGDKCNLSTDCSLRGDRLCDTSQPGGYCTQFNCKGNDCPDNAACVMFHASVQGCGYDDRSPSRTARTFCMATCGSNGDCRAGYVCADPRQAPWTALVLDNNQTVGVCIVPPDNGVIGADASTLPDYDAAVCSPNSPDADFSEAGIFADGAAEASADAASDAGPRDASADVSDAGAADAPEGG